MPEGRHGATPGSGNVIPFLPSWPKVRCDNCHEVYTIAVDDSYPPLFQINRLVQGGAITPATALEWAEKDRYAPEVLTALGEYWAQGTTRLNVIVGSCPRCGQQRFSSMTTGGIVKDGS